MSGCGLKDASRTRSPACLSSGCAIDTGRWHRHLSCGVIWSATGLDHSPWYQMCCSTCCVTRGSWRKPRGASIK
uniref:Uncharacterized protein n=1 Tax=Arundo donax TaxID=35708 RepID=A0A0A9CWJ3_ARUDO